MGRYHWDPFECDKIVQVVESGIALYNRPQTTGIQPVGFVRCPLLPHLPPVLVDSMAVLTHLGSRMRYGPHSYVNDRPLVQYAYNILWKTIQLRNSAVMIDVGANTGSFSLLPAILPGLFVEAFEPLPTTFSMLKRNVEVNQIARHVHLHQMAVSSEPRANMALQVPSDYHSKGGGSISTLGMTADRIVNESRRSGGDGNFTSVSVPVTTLDASLPVIQHIDLLKVDVEGWELFVLRGAKYLIMTHRPVIMLEREPRNMQQCGVTDIVLDAEIEHLGYTCFKMGEDNHVCSHSPN